MRGEFRENQKPITFKSNQGRIQDFPEVGVQTLRGGAKIQFAKISQKLHEIERIWTPTGARPSRPPP